MTARQLRFCSEYVVDSNGTQAAIRAGYSRRSANPQAARLLAKANISERIATLEADVLQALHLHVVDVRRAVARHIHADGHSDVRDYQDDEGNYLPLSKLSESAALNLSGFEVVKKNLVSGDGKVDEIHRYRLRDQLGYVRLGAEILGMLAEKVEHTHLVVVADGLAAGRQRSRARRLSSQPAAVIAEPAG